MKKHDARELLKKYIEGNCTEEEKAIVESWHLEQLVKTGNDLSKYVVDQAGERIWKKLPVHETPKPARIGWRTWAAAAILILALTISYSLFFQHESTNQQAQQLPADTLQNDVLPGGNKAILTLANGTRIILDTAQNGLLTTQQQAQIHKGEGSITYDASSAQTIAGNMQYNTLSVPVGGQYQITLPDGTQVWMNALSTLRFPVVFTGNERKVELTGEAYFEVAKNKAMPFKVVTPQQEVEVLGTHFNINAYEDEPEAKTTLIEGAVQVTNAAATMTIKPGQQTVVNRATGTMKKQTADVEHTLAWKNGYFQFKDEKLDVIMRRVARWYDIEVQFQPGYTQEGFIGNISRYETVSKVLKVLKLTEKVNFRLEGKKVIVMP